MQLFWKSFRGPTLVFNVKEEMLVEELKDIIWARDGIPVERQRLMINAKLLTDGKTLGELGVKDEETISVYIKSTLNPSTTTTIGKVTEEGLWVKDPLPVFKMK